MGPSDQSGYQSTTLPRGAFLPIEESHEDYHSNLRKNLGERMQRRFLDDIKAGQINLDVLKRLFQQQAQEPKHTGNDWPSDFWLQT